MLHDLNLKLYGNDKLIPRLVNDFSAFNMKIKPFISQLKSKEFIKFPQLREQSECAEDLTNIPENIEKIMLVQDTYKSRISDFAEEEDCILAFINQFSRSEQNILKMPSDHRWS